MSNESTSIPAVKVDEAIDERALFEAWAVNTAPGHPLTLTTTGEYVDYPTHCAYRAWQARAALAARQAPDGGDTWDTALDEAKAAVISVSIAYENTTSEAVRAIEALKSIA